MRPPPATMSAPVMKRAPILSGRPISAGSMVSGPGRIAGLACSSGVVRRQWTEVAPTIDPPGGVAHTGRVRGGEEPIGIFCNDRDQRGAIFAHGPKAGHWRYNIILLQTGGDKAEYRISPRDAGVVPGEGLTWSASHQRLLWGHSVGQRRWSRSRRNDRNDRTGRWPETERVGRVVEPERDIRLLAGLKSGSAALSLDPISTGSLYAPERDRPDGRLNDAKVAAAAWMIAIRIRAVRFTGLMQAARRSGWYGS